MTASSVLIASASIARADGRGSAPVASPFNDLSLGQNLKLRVLRQIDQQRYELSFAGRRHVVESRVPLQVGTQIQARVESKGAQLELRYLSTEARFEDEAVTEDETSPATPDTDPAAAPPWLTELAVQYRVSLDAHAQAVITRAASQVAEPELMTRGGLFLQKLAHAVTPRDIEALYQALTASQVAGAGAASEPIDLEGLATTEDRGTTLADALDARIDRLGDDTQSDDGGSDDGRRALRLLNLQDEGSVAWRYGTLPILVAGQLIELDLVMFREREPHAARGGLKRLVMTLDTTHFGRVRVEARALDNRLIVKLQAASADAVEVMSAYGGEVRAAIEQLGWQVDEVAYEVTAQSASAARAVVDHVLSAGSVDREL